MKPALTHGNPSTYVTEQEDEWRMIRSSIYQSTVIGATSRALVWQGGLFHDHRPEMQSRKLFLRSAHRFPVKTILCRDHGEGYSTRTNYHVLIQLPIRMIVRDDNMYKVTDDRSRVWSLLRVLDG
jgi:hypothetical protein